MYKIIMFFFGLLLFHPHLHAGISEIESNTTQLKQDKYWDDGTSFFLKLYGNYGGFGNRGGEPWDDLDRAFQKHDYRYGEYGFLDAKSDARLLEEILTALFHKNIHKEGYIMGPAIFIFLATALPSVYRIKPFGNKLMILLPMSNSSCAFCTYKIEQILKDKKSRKKVEKFFKSFF